MTMRSSFHVQPATVCDCEKITHSTEIPLANIASAWKQCMKKLARYSVFATNPRRKNSRRRLKRFIDPPPCTS
jgi:hypothetical protein